jgi:hypothetical protein
MIRSFRHACQRTRAWHSPTATSIWAGVRYSLTGDTGYFRSHVDGVCLACTGGG